MVMPLSDICKVSGARSASGWKQDYEAYDHRLNEDINIIPEQAPGEFDCERMHTVLHAYLNVIRIAGHTEELDLGPANRTLPCDSFTGDTFDQLHESIITTISPCIFSIWELHHLTRNPPISQGIC
jgi:hypothetical protein